MYNPYLSHTFSLHLIELKDGRLFKVSKIMMFDFSGIWLPLITPFSQQVVDSNALQKLVTEYRSTGIAGFVSLSTTGEANLLSSEEQDLVLKTTIQAADGLPVIAGLTGSNFTEIQQRLAQLSHFNLAGILVSSPAYIRPSQQGLIEYFVKLAELSPFPVIIYEIPYRTGIHLELSSLLTLAKHPNIQAIKDCAGSSKITQALITDGNLQVLAGEDFNIFQTLCMGGRGAIGAAVHIYPERYVQMEKYIQAGQLEHAQRIFSSLTPLIENLFAEPNPAPIKGLLASYGKIKNEFKFPLQKASPTLIQSLEELHVQIGSEQLIED